jgi:hypothetical protein
MLCVLLGGVLPAACVYDPDQRCGPHQRYLEPDRCECIDGYVPAAEGCQPCADNEREANGACVCVDGYARSSDAAACEEIPGELGLSCDPKTPCPAGRYDLCQATDGDAGYCTKACRDDADCDGGYRCDRSAAAAFCRRPPLGFGKTCRSDDDCGEGEATYCDTISTKLCLVRCSAGDADVCFIGESCCDFTIFTPICTPTAACTQNGGKVLE